MRQLLHNNKAEGGGAVVGSVVALLVSIIIGVLIWYKINAGITGSGGSMFASQTNAGLMAGKAFNASNATANTIWTLMPIIAIVVIAGIILAIVTNFGRGGQA